MELDLHPDIKLLQMKYFGLFVLLLLPAVFSPAIAGDKMPARWGKVSQAEFNIKPAANDSLAPAIVLFDFGNIEVSNRTFYTRHTRIKILREEGLKYATVEIPYKKQYRYDEFFKLKGRTLVVENGIVKSYPVDAGDMDDFSGEDGFQVRRFTFPKVRPGAIIEFQYVIASLDFEQPDTWYFQREIPTIWSEVRFEVPVPFLFLVTFQNRHILTSEEEQDYAGQLQWLYNTKYRKRKAELADKNALLFAAAGGNYKVWAMNNMKKRIVMRNLPGIKPGDVKGPVFDLYPQLRFHLFESSGNLPRSYRPMLLSVRDDFEYQGEWSLSRGSDPFIGYIHYRLKTWEQWNARLLEHPRFGGYLMRSSGRDSLLSLSGPDELKMRAVYAFMLQNYTWNGQYTLYGRENPENLLQSKSGSSAELNLILVSLLRKAGIEADPMVIRTADRGRVEKVFPSGDQFNHVIAVAQAGGEQYLLDLTSGTSDPTLINRTDLGTSGWVVKRDHPGWIETFEPEFKPGLDGDAPPSFNL